MLSGKTGPPEHSPAVWASPAALLREYLVTDGRTCAHGDRHRARAGSVGAVGTRRASGVRSAGGLADSAEGAGPAGGHADPGAGDRAARGASAAGAAKRSRSRQARTFRISRL